MVGARTPLNSLFMPPWRSTAMSAIESASATIPATSFRRLQPGGVARPVGDGQVMLGEVNQAGSGGQRHRRDQPGVRHEVRVVKHHGSHREHTGNT